MKFEAESFLSHLDSKKIEYKLFEHAAFFTVEESSQLKTDLDMQGAHTENLFLSTDLIVNTRVLVFMTYLNDIADGGTLFAEQELYVPALKGLTLIWPAGFTHPHKSQVTYSSEKSIITGWLNNTFANKTDERFHKSR